MVGIRGREMNFKILNRLMICAGVGTVVLSVVALAPSAATAQGRTPNTPIELHDKDGDGKISADEWPRPNFSAVDQNKDGFLTPEEFSVFWNIPMPDQAAPATTTAAPSKPAPAVAAAQGKNPNAPIKNFDKNGDGKLSPDEWTKPNFTQIDQDKDGFLTPDDFAKFWGMPLPAQGAAGQAQDQPQARPGQGGGGQGGAGGQSARGAAPNPAQIFRHQDANGDGVVSRDEFRGPPPKFDSLDADGDGFLSAGELPGGAQGAGGQPGAGQACPEQPGIQADSPYIIEKNSPDCAFAGTTLFADAASVPPKIVEIDMNGQVVWQHVLPRNNTTICKKTKCKTTYGPMTPTDVTRLENGNTLIVTKFNGIFEVDRTGKVVWEYIDNKASHDVDRLPNGNTLYVRGFVQKGEDHIREVTPEGKVVWSWNGLKQYDRKPYASIEDEGWMHANAVTRMPNGNTWISLRNFDIFAEVDRAGNLVREVKLPLPGSMINPSAPRPRKQPENTFRLVCPHDPEVESNGNILIPHSCNGLLVETDSSGTRITFQKRFKMTEGIAHIRDANRLPNGNILITSGTRLVEITAQGQVIWQMKHSKLGDRPDQNKISIHSMSAGMGSRMVFAPLTGSWRGSVGHDRGRAWGRFR